MIPDSGLHISKFIYHFHRLRSFILIIPFSFLIFHFSTGQDTTFRYYPQFTRYTTLSQPDSIHPLDTTINFFQRFHPAEQPFGYLHLGYAGAPAMPLFFIPRKDAEVDIGFQQFNAYWRGIDDVKFYDTREAFTSVRYQQGSRNEILVSAIHAQNITPQLGFGIDYNRLRTDGWYQRQTSRLSNFNGYAQYHSPNNFYSVKAAYILNNFNVQINGGITNDLIFSDSTLFDKSLATVYLDSASSVLKSDELVLVNAINFGRKVFRETIDSVEKKKIIPEFRLQHRAEWERRRFFFNDSFSDASFYTDDTLNFAAVSDSFIVRRIANEVRLSKLVQDSTSRLFKFSADAFARFSVFQVHNQDYVKQIQSGIIGANFSTLFFSKLKLSSFGELNLLDRNMGDFVLNASMIYLLTDQRVMGAEAMISNNHPALIEDEYHSTYFNWDNSFVPMTALSGNVFYRDQKLKLVLKAGWFSQSDYIYWTTGSIPVQNGTLSGLQFSAAKNFRVTRFHLDNEVMYQTFNDKSIVSYPSFILRSSLYYQDDEYRHALQSKIGFDVRYHTNYFAPAYQPATGQFLVQRTLEFEYLPVVDLFVVVKVKAVRGYIVLQNAAQGLFENGNFAAVHYPMADRAVKFGLQWMFWN